MKSGGQHAVVYSDALRTAAWIVQNLDGATTLGARIQTLTYGLLEDVACAQAGGDRLEHLHDADVRLVRLRVLFRLALDVGLLAEPGFLHVSRELDGIGRQIGGWLKWLAERGGEG